MPGIVVGVDGSATARRALEWAVKEAAIRHSPITVLTIHEVARSFWTGVPITLPADEALLEKARGAAAELTDKVTSELGDAAPASVTVNAVNGFAAKELINASHDADLVVVGAHGGAHGDGLAYQPVGSVSNKLIHHAACPVVVVPAGG
jgi:nucleotide-binding universal stress UspA family protein